MSVLADATSAVLAENQFNDPPEAGRQFFIVTLQARYLGQGSSEFYGAHRLRTVGESGVVHTTFENSCGVIPGELPDPEVFTGGAISGSECWEILSTDADSLQMFVDHPFFGDEERVWFALRPGE